MNITSQSIYVMLTFVLWDIKLKAEGETFSHKIDKGKNERTSLLSHNWPASGTVLLLNRRKTLWDSVFILTLVYMFILKLKMSLTPSFKTWGHHRWNSAKGSNFPNEPRPSCSSSGKCNRMCFGLVRLCKPQRLTYLWRSGGTYVSKHRSVLFVLLFLLEVVSFPRQACVPFLSAENSLHCESTRRFWLQQWSL